MHRLRIDTDSRDVEPLHRGDFISGYSVRASALNGKLLDAFAIEILMNKLQHLGEEPFRQRAWSATANVNRLHLEAVTFNRLRRRLNVTCQSRHEFSNSIFGRQLVRWEGAIKATRLAKGNADVDTNLFVARIDNRQLTDCDFC